MDRDIAQIGEMDPAVRQKLVDAGIVTVDQLLERTASQQQRDALAERLGVNRGRLTEWVNRADLLRIRGIDGDLATLLEAAGIDSSQELRRWDPQELLSHLIATNDQKRIVPQTPDADDVEQWIRAAAALTTPHQPQG